MRVNVLAGFEVQGQLLHVSENYFGNHVLSMPIRCRFDADSMSLDVRGCTQAPQCLGDATK
jgi:hypothetical protein